MVAEIEHSSSSLQQAIRNESISTKRGLLQKLFAFWFDAFVYNQIWEDPRADLEALRLDENSRVLTISSGGCNALNYLLAGPQSVTAVDLNRHHVYLLNLKLAALQNLPTYENFFDFFGFGGTAEAEDLYKRWIAPRLDPDTRTFWESNSVIGGLIHGNRISFFRNGGLYDHSRNGFFLKFFHRYARVLGCKPARILDAETAGEQAAIFKDQIDPFFDNFVFRLVGRLPVTMFGLGIPPQQYEELKKELTGGGTIIDVYRERVRRLACDFPIGENYFAWQAFARKYDTEKRIAVPEYLKQENYELLKSNAGKLTTRIDSVTGVIKSSPARTFNRFVFLDAQDWMDADVFIDLWTALSEMAEPGSRIIFRTAGSASPIESALPESLKARFTYEKELSHQLFKNDRSSIYGGFHVYVLKHGHSDHGA